jgi:hypothetical protein
VDLYAAAANPARPEVIAYFDELMDRSAVPGREKKP